MQYTNDEKNYGLNDYQKIKSLFDKNVTLRQIRELYKVLKREKEMNIEKLRVK